MCSQDLSDARKAKSISSGSKTITTTVELLVPYNEKRTSLIIGVATGTSMLLTLGNPQTPANELLIASQSGTFQLNIRDHGAMVYGPIFARVGAGTLVYTFWESVITD